MPYRPQIKTANGLVDFPLDAETVKGKTILEQTYPVGAIYISTNSTSPASLFGGTWQQIKDTFILAAGDTYTAGATGGEATHTLTTQEMPSHRHEVQDFNNVKVGNVRGSTYELSLPNTSYNNPSGGANYLITSYEGGGQAHNNMPPYLTVYMWKRTA